MTRQAAPGPAGPGDLAGLLAAGAGSLLAEAAAVRLLAGHGRWLARADFTGPFIAAGPSPLSGQPLAHVRWKAAARALAGGQLPASRTEQAILRIAASLAADVPVRLGDTITGLDPLTELPREAARFGGQPAGAVGTFPAHGHRRRVTQGPGIAGRSPRGFASGYRRPVGAVSAA